MFQRRNLIDRINLLLVPGRPVLQINWYQLYLVLQPLIVPSNPGALCERAN
ncbi:hypothetical protein T12_16068, partial [Trichinella patagoniensis]